MIRRTSIEAYHKIKEQGLLSERRMEIYEILFDHGPLTASEIEIRIHRQKSPSRGSNVHARLNEMVKMGCVDEVGLRDCPVSGMQVIKWDVTDRLPVKFEAEKRIKCCACNGKGYVVEQQSKMF